jgi:hypothetical protein
MPNPDWTAKHQRAILSLQPQLLVGTPAYKLTQEQARDLAVAYVLENRLTFEKPVMWGGDGRPIWPRIGDKVKLKLQSFSGVDFVPDSSAAAGWTTTGPMDLRTACLAVRMAKYLREDSQWGVSTIYWGGMGVGRDPSDRHSKGFAIDIHGAMTRSGRFDVAHDWGDQAITLPDGKTARAWPATQQPYFRLDVDTPAGGFFYALYHFLAGEAVDNGRDQPSSIGDRSYILCPDTPDVSLRPSHQDHIHCEVDR